MEKILTHKLYVGSNEKGERLWAAFKEIAKKHYGGNISRLFVYSVCERYGYDPRTGLKRENGHKKDE